MGRRDQISRTRALELCRQITMRLGANPRSRDLDRSWTIGAWVARFLELRTDLGEGSIALYGDTLRYLKAKFGEDRKLAAVNADAADGFRLYLQKLTEGDPPVRKLSDDTVDGHLRRCRTLWSEAMRKSAATTNPFAGVRTGVEHEEPEFLFITLDGHWPKIMAKITNPHHRTLLALCRLAGLRSFEAMGLKWSTDIDWTGEHGSGPFLHVRPPKGEDGRRRKNTKRKYRTVPIRPELLAILREAHTAAEEAGEDRVVPLKRINLDRALRALYKRACLPPFAKPLHTLRKSCETEWINGRVADVMTVCKWLGHSPAVAFKHYQKVRAEDMAKISKPAEAAA